MRVKILNHDIYEFNNNTSFPIEVEARLESCGGYSVRGSELHANSPDEFDNDECMYYFEKFNVREIKDNMNETGVNDTHCVRDKCCNQFGERDEIQTIINSLQADVVARGNRITELERALQGEQVKSEQLYRLALDLGACPEFMKVNFACDWAVMGDVDD